MSEYQYYEFQAIDRPLTGKDIDKLRALSTRAEITETRFINTYNYGDFRGDPVDLMKRYFDAFVYVANWGTRRLMLRLPKEQLNPKTAALYSAGDNASVHTAGEHVLVELRSESEGGDWEDGEGWLSSLVPIRGDLLHGDLRSLYLGWLLGVQSGDVPEEEKEPPVPPGLGALSGPLKSLADFLRIDPDLIAVAAERNGPIARRTQATLRRSGGGEADERRTSAELLAAAEDRAESERKREQERIAARRARQDREQAAARSRHLDQLAPRKDETWRHVDELIETKRPQDYDRAVELLGDLHDLSRREGEEDAFAARLVHLRERHARKSSLLGRLTQAGMGGPVSV